MASGPRSGRSNRFDLLDMTPAKKKRKGGGGTKNMASFPSLPEIKADDPKYIVIESNDNNKPISSPSCFGVHRSLLAISKDILTISQLRDGKLLLLVKSRSVAQKFISTKSLPSICDISCKYHETLNLSKGTVYAPFLNNDSEEEIVKALASQGVVSAFKFKKNLEGKDMPTGVVLLTFDLHNLPHKVDIAWIKVQCKLYIPAPMRCKNCNILGHTITYCKKTPYCVNCALPPHGDTGCTRTFCINCAQKHAASSKDCTKYQQAKELMKIKTENKCSVSEANKILKQQTNNIPSLFASYASVVIDNKSNNNQTTNIQNTTNSTPFNPSLTYSPNNVIQFSKSSETTHTLSSKNITKNINNASEATNNRPSSTNSLSSKEEYIKKPTNNQTTRTQSTPNSTSFNPSLTYSPNKVTQFSKNSESTHTLSPNLNITQYNNSDSIDLESSNRPKTTIEHTNKSFTKYLPAHLQARVNAILEDDLNDTSPPRTTTPTSSLYEPLPTLNKVLSSQSLHLDDDEMST